MPGVYSQGGGGERRGSQERAGVGDKQSGKRDADGGRRKEAMESVGL